MAQFSYLPDINICFFCRKNMKLGFISDFICIFALAICLWWLRCTLRCVEPKGGALHCGKSDTVRFVFGDLNYHHQIPSKDNSRGDAYGCVYTQPECAEGTCTLTHTFGIIVYTLKWVFSLFVLMGWLW